MANGASMAAAADELSQNLRDQFLQCKVCLDGLKNPKTLPCLHTFCAECIHCYITQNSRGHDGRTFPCPICRRHIYLPKDGVDAFPDSFFVRSLNDVLLHSSTRPPKIDCAICKFKNGHVEGKALCVECRVELCNDCASDHRTASVTQAHTLLQLFGSTPGSSGVNRENYCRVHKGETVKYYCETCNCPVCLPCTFLDHRGHQIQEIRSVRQQFVDDIEKLVIQSEDNIIQLQSARDDLAELENELFVRKEAIKTQIRRCVQETVRAINDREAQLVSEVEAFYDTLPVSTDRQQVEKTIYRLQRAHDFARQLMANDTSPITQLVNRLEAKDNLCQAQVYELPDLSLHLQKLNSNICFLPGHVTTGIGSMVRCGSSSSVSMQESSSQAVLVLCAAAAGAGNRALFLWKLTSNAGPRSAECTGARQPRTGLNSRRHSMSDIVSVVFLPNGDCAILSMTKKFVKIFDSRGALRCEFGDEETGTLLQPSDMVVTHDGELAITDCGLLCVKVFDSAGSQQLEFGGSDVFTLPIAITIDSIGRFLVLDQVKQRVTIHRQHGELLQSHDIAELTSPQHIALFAQSIFIADSINNTVAIYRYSKDGLQFIGKLSAGTSTLEFLDCSGICVDRSGNLLISDSILNRIHVFTSTGQFGSLLAAGHSFYRSSCLAVSSGGLLAVVQQTGRALDALPDDDAETEQTSGGSVDLETSQGSGQGFGGHNLQCRDDCDDELYEVAVYRIIKSDSVRN